MEINYKRNVTTGYLHGIYKLQAYQTETIHGYTPEICVNAKDKFFISIFSTIFDKLPLR